MPFLQPAAEGGGAGGCGAGLVPPGRGPPHRRSAAQPRHLQVETKTLLRIRDPVPVDDPSEPGWVKNQDTDPGSFIFQRAQKQFFGQKILKFFDADADPRSGIFLTRELGWKNVGPELTSRLRNTGQRHVFRQKT